MISSIFALNCNSCTIRIKNVSYIYLSRAQYITCQHDSCHFSGRKGLLRCCSHVMARFGNLYINDGLVLHRIRNPPPGCRHITPLPVIWDADLLPTFHFFHWQHITHGNVLLLCRNVSVRGVRCLNDLRLLSPNWVPHSSNGND